MSDEVLQVPIETELDALYGAYIAAEQAPGVVYGLTGPDGLVHARGFGRRGPDGGAPDLDTVFPIASMSKSFCACAALIARDRGLISLDDPIDRHVPEFRLADGPIEADGMPTVGMLLSMAGGLTEDNAWIDPAIAMPAEQLLALVAGGVQLSRQPGTAYEYSNLGYQMACLAVGRALGRPIMDFIADEILAPLGMTRTHPDTAAPVDANLATGHKLDVDGNWTPFPPVASDAYAGACGLNSCVRDLARWITWLGAAFRPDAGEGDLVLSRISRRELQRVHMPGLPSLTVGAAGGAHTTSGGYALGLIVDYHVQRGMFVGHAGGLPGFLLYMRWHPASGHGVVTLTNSHRGSGSALGVEALARMLDRAATPAAVVALWPQTLELRAKTESLIRSWNDELAAELFADNIDFDRPIGERRRAIDALIDQVGPLLPPSARTEIVSTTSPADVTWSIPAERGELLVMIHLTPVRPAQVQELAVTAANDRQPRAAHLLDISAGHSPGNATITPTLNVELS